jgi:hypothetical protein
MERYIYTVLYMYKHEAEFPQLFAQSKGMCLKHYQEALAMAPKHLTGDRLKQFVDTLVDLEVENFERLANGKVKQFSNSGFGDAWYALGLEEMKVKAQRQKMPRPY